MGRVDNQAALARWRAQSYGSFYHYMNHCRRPRQFAEFNNLVVAFNPALQIPDPSVVPHTQLIRPQKLGKPFSAYEIDHLSTTSISGSIAFADVEMASNLVLSPCLFL